MASGLRLSDGRSSVREDSFGARQEERSWPAASHAQTGRGSLGDDRGERSDLAVKLLDRRDDQGDEVDVVEAEGHLHADLELLFPGARAARAAGFDDAVVAMDLLRGYLGSGNEPSLVP